MIVSSQILWCAGCHTAFPFNVGQHWAVRQLVVRHDACGALNVIAVRGETEEGYDLYKVVREAEAVH